MFEQWTDEQFIIWFAGFFDGEGCIYIPKGPGAEVSVANTNREVIEAIHQRLNLGIVVEVEFVSHNWNTKYHWRLRNLPEIYDLLTRLRPFLTIKAEKADRALAKAGLYVEAKRALAERNVGILEMLKTHKQHEVATAFNLTRQTVATVSATGGRIKKMGRRRRSDVRPDDVIRQHVQTHKKELAHPTTKTRLLT
jgi:hypothetical protein